MRSVVAMICALSLLFQFQLAGAAESSKQDKAEARKIFRRAQLDFKLGKFEKALAGYQRAYALTSMAALLFNVGQCHRKLGDHKKAIFFYKGYLREKPQARNRKIVEELIADSERLLTAEREKQRKLKAEAAERERRQREEAKRREAARLKYERELALTKAKAEAARRAREEAETRARLVAEQEARARAAEPAAYERWWFWTIVGGVVLAAAGGTAWALTSKETKVLPEGSLGTLDLRSN